MEGMLGGIMMPKTKNRWVLKNVSNLTEDEIYMLTDNLVVCHFDYNPDTAFDTRYGFEPQHNHTLLLVIEDPIKEGMADIIDKLCNATEPFDITVDTVDGSQENVTQRAVYHRCKVKRYNYNLDYAASETCKYPVLFSVGNVRHWHPATDKYFNTR